MELIKKLFGLTSKQLQISEIIEIVNQNPDIRIQETRKRNLQLAIVANYGGNVLDFATALNKNVLFIKGLLIPIEKRISRRISDKTARLLETNLRIKSGTLDTEVAPNFNQNYIPFICVNESLENNCLSYSTDKENLFYDGHGYKTQHLLFLDTSEIDQITTAGIVVSGATILIDRDTEETLVITRNDKNLVFNGKIVDTFNKRENHD